jgi:hypothetical protein
MALWLLVMVTEVEWWALAANYSGVQISDG